MEEDERGLKGRREIRRESGREWREEGVEKGRGNVRFDGRIRAEGSQEVDSEG